MTPTRIAIDFSTEIDFDACSFCGKIAHHGACAELIAYTEQVKARLYRHNPRPCPDCGDLITGMCPACWEWECKQIDLDFAPIGWA